jgi:DNA sulfur modification protein DndB
VVNITGFCTHTPDPKLPEFKTFQDEFSIDVGYGFNSKKERMKWISLFNSYRNVWAHEGSKDQRLNREEVSLLSLIHEHFYG